MSIIKKSVTIILWGLLVIVGSIVLSNLAHGMGGNATEAWLFVKSLCVGSTLFWCVGILLLLQVVFINLNAVKYRAIIVAVLAVIACIVSFMLYRDLSGTMAAYKQIVLDTDGIPEIGMAVYNYRKYILLYSIISSVLAIINPIILLVIGRENSKK